MDDGEEDTFSQIPPSPLPVATNYNGTTTQLPVEREEEFAKYLCHLCMKSFYNENALQNHKNMSHDINDSNEEDKIDWSSCVKLEQNVNGLYGFKFIPINPEDSEQIILKKVFSEDTSYLIVKVEDEDVDNFDKMRKSRLDSIVRKNQQKIEKSPVDLRGPFTCTLPSTMRPDIQCRQIFFSCCEYSLHYREEHTKRRKAALRCQVCEKRLDRDLSASTSFADQYHAANAFTFSCRMCGLKFLDDSKFDEHNRIMHAKMKPHQCPICFKRFTQQGGLQQHIRMHTGIRPYACTFCPKAFTQKAGLDQHLRTHTKVKPFKCVICSKCFSQSVHLRQHMRTHTNIQPFKCSVCGKRFKQRSHLNFHLRSHMSGSGVYMENQQPDPMDFFKLANLQPVQDGETLYYAAELASEPSTTLSQSLYNNTNPFVNSSPA